MIKLKQREEQGLSKEQAQAKAQLQSGVILYGYCGGIFGRDSYGNKMVQKVEGNTLLQRKKRENS
jgi:hypothetical protein